MGWLKACWSYLCAFGGLIAELFGNVRRAEQAVTLDDDASTGGDGIVAEPLREHPDKPYVDRDRRRGASPAALQQGGFWRRPSK
jgi:hypothetical protein